MAAFFKDEISSAFILIVLAVIFVNGFTDAPNAISCAIATRALKKNTAVLIAALMNFSGLCVFASFFPAVTKSVTETVLFDMADKDSMTAMLAAMTAVVLWAAAAWLAGIPTSESHALIAGLTGANIALSASIGNVNAQEWIKILYGLILSLAAGGFCGFAFAKVITKTHRKKDHKTASRIFKRWQTAAAMGAAFMHGAQDGQKFLGVMLLGLTGTQSHEGSPFLFIVVCAATMALGTLFGGGRIIKKMGLDMVKLKSFQGFSSDIAASAVMLISTLSGIQQSTTHTKTSAIAGAGAAVRLKSIDMGILKSMFLAWALTFPLCGAIGFFMTKIFLALF